MKQTESSKCANPSQLITNQIAELGDWRGRLLAQLRQLILAAVPEISEEWKWGTAVWMPRPHEPLISMKATTWMSPG